jgi:transposase
MPPAYVMPYVKRCETDACRCGSGLRSGDAADDAVRTREVPRTAGAAVDAPDARLAGQQRTQAINMIRGLLAEFGIDIPKGLERAVLMTRRIVDGEAPDVPMEAAQIVGTLSQCARHSHSAT